MSTDVRFRFEGKTIDLTELDDKCPRGSRNLVVGDKLPEPDLVYVYSSEEHFCEALGDLGITEEVGQAFEKRDYVESLSPNDITYIGTRLRIRTTAISEELRALAAKERIEVRSADLFNRARIATHPLDSKVFGSGIAYEHINFEGAFLPFPGTVPSLVPLGWNDIISSVRYAGSLSALCEHTFFKGEKFWLVGIASVPDLRDYAFNDKTSSIL